MLPLEVLQRPEGVARAAAASQSKIEIEILQTTTSAFEFPEKKTVLFQQSSDDTREEEEEDIRLLFWNMLALKDGVVLIQSDKPG